MGLWSFGGVAIQRGSCSWVWKWVGMCGRVGLVGNGFVWSCGCLEMGLCGFVRSPIVWVKVGMGLAIWVWPANLCGCPRWVATLHGNGRWSSVAVVGLGPWSRSCWCSRISGRGGFEVIVVVVLGPRLWWWPWWVRVHCRGRSELPHLRL